MTSFLRGDYGSTIEHGTKEGYLWGKYLDFRW